MSDSTDSITLIQERMWSVEMDQIVAEALEDILRRKGSQTDYEDKSEGWLDAFHDQSLENSTRNL